MCLSCWQIGKDLGLKWVVDGWWEVGVTKPCFKTVESVSLPFSFETDIILGPIFKMSLLAQSVAIVLQSFIWEQIEILLKGEVKIQSDTLSNKNREQK